MSKHTVSAGQVAASARGSDIEVDNGILQAMIDALPVQLAYLDVDFNFVYVNAAYALAAGYESAALIGRNHFACFPDADNQRIFERVRDRGERAIYHAKPFRYADRPELGVTYWDWTLTPIKDARGQVVGLILITEDVTERQRSRDALRRYTSRLHLLHDIDRAIMEARSLEATAEAALQGIPMLIPCVRADVILLDAARETATLLAAYAARPSELRAGWETPVARVALWDVAQWARGDVCVVEDLRALPKPDALARQLIADGARGYVAVPLRVQDLLIGALCLGLRGTGALTDDAWAFARELTSSLAIGIHHEQLRQEAELYAVRLERSVARRTAALRASEARFRSIFENAGIGIALLDAAGHILTANPMLQAMLGYDRATLLKRPWADYLHPDDVAVHAEHFAALMAAQRARYRSEMALLDKDGRRIWTDMTLSLIRDEHGQPNFAVALVMDISQRRQAQEALVQTEKLALTGRLAASLAHEINNPLQTVIGCLGLAREIREEGGDVGEFLDIGLEELKRAARIVISLRDLNRRAEPEEREPCDVSALVARLPVLMQKKCRDRHVTLTWQAEDGIPPILGVADRVQQVFLNLALNALDAMPEGGALHIAVTATERPAGVKVTFADTGVGMREDTLSRLFDAFYTTKSRGLGLGLFSSQAIVEDHGGHIDVESRPGEGSTFAVWLPRAAD